MKLDRLIICVVLALVAFVVCGCDESPAAEPNESEYQPIDNRNRALSFEERQDEANEPWDGIEVGRYVKMTELWERGIYQCPNCAGITKDYDILISHNCRSTTTGKRELPLTEPNEPNIPYEDTEEYFIKSTGFTWEMAESQAHTIRVYEEREAERKRQAEEASIEREAEIQARAAMKLIELMDNREQ